MRIIILFISILQANIAIAEDFLGNWVVDKITTSHISNLTPEEASKYIGYELTYQHNNANSGTDICENVSYQIEAFNERDLHTYHKVFFSDLSRENIEWVSNIEVRCNRNPWFNFGAFIIQAGTKVFVSHAGYIYELRRKNT